MPIITNRCGYPDYVVAAATKGLHKPEDGLYGVTSLCDSPTVRHYRSTRWDELIFDVDDSLWAMFGTAWHQYLNQFMGDKYVGEQTLAMAYEDIMVRGQIDTRSLTGIIDDHKVTSAWSFVFGKKAWEQQLNLYSLLCAANGITITQLYINAFLRDWSATNSKRFRDYPRQKFYRVKTPLWPKEQQYQFLKDRVADHKTGPRPCTDEERWARPTQWAVMKPGVKTARRVLDSEENAQKWMEKQKNNINLYIEKRPGSCLRCNEYCVARAVCEFKETRDA